MSTGVKPSIIPLKIIGVIGRARLSQARISRLHGRQYRAIVGERIAAKVEVESPREHARIADRSDAAKWKAGVDGHADLVVGDSVVLNRGPYVSRRLGISQGAIDGEDAKAEAEARNPVVSTKV